MCAAGPTEDHEVTLVYTRSGLPVEITAESDNWRRIRDWEGSEGWVYHSLLSGRRTAVVTPRTRTSWCRSTIAATATRGGRATAGRRARRGEALHQGWCRIIGNGFDGWIEQEQLWGVYPNEKVE